MARASRPCQSARPRGPRLTVQFFRPRSFADAVAAATEARAGFTSADVERGRPGSSSARSRTVSPGCARIPTSTRSSSCGRMQGVLAAKRAASSRLDVDVVAFSTSRNDLAETHAVERSSAPSSPGQFYRSKPQRQQRCTASNRCSVHPGRAQQFAGGSASR